MNITASTTAFENSKPNGGRNNHGCLGRCPTQVGVDDVTGLGAGKRGANRSQNSSVASTSTGVAVSKADSAFNC
ncbi:MAG: hypothetical protein SVX38_05630, partial [Chloroflexota bacterium]|nr:hypothetical protein [Chloroflexota bacterium]